MGTIFFAAEKHEVEKIGSFDDVVPLFERMGFCPSSSSLRSVRVLLEILVGRSEGVFIPISNSTQPPEYVFQLEQRAIHEIAALEYEWLMEQSVVWAKKGFLGVEVNSFDCAADMAGIQSACKYALEQKKPLFVFLDDEK